MDMRSLHSFNKAERVSTWWRSCNSRQHTHHVVEKLAVLIVQLMRTLMDKMLHATAKHMHVVVFVQDAAKGVH
jgi:hypothetical protein